MQTKITRSPGIPVHAGVQGYIVGGGYTGITDELDRTVAQAAEALHAAYGMDVTIRYNSDRESGGAWLVTHAQDGVWANAEIGICASVVTERAHKRHERFVAKYGDMEGIVMSPVGTMTICAHLSEAASDCGYHHEAKASVDEALRFVLAHGSLEQVAA